MDTAAPLVQTSKEHRIRIQDVLQTFAIQIRSRYFQDYVITADLVLSLIKSRGDVYKVVFKTYVTIGKSDHQTVTVALTVETMKEHRILAPDVAPIVVLPIRSLLFQDNVLSVHEIHTLALINYHALV